ncbi:MAG: 2-hydroxyacyl-CoA dehydratase family protein, partial [Thermodesulfobacteriota bacterium]
MEGLEDFKKVLADPAGYARGLKDQGRKIIGYFCSYAPEELILAAGAHPFRLFGTREQISLADAHLQSYCCSLARGALEEALSGRLAFLEGAVFPHTCDTIQRLSDLWRLNTSFGFFADVVLPVKLDTPAAAK